MRNFVLFTAVILLTMFSSKMMQAQVLKTLDIATVGTLGTSLTANELANITHLTITGTIDARDFKTMKVNMPSLLNIDLSSVSIVAYTGTAGTRGTMSTTYPINELPYSAFQGRSSLTSVTIPSGVTSIGINAFSNCSSIISFTIPATVSSIGSLAFQYFRGSIVVEETNSNYSSADGVLFNKTKTQLIQCSVSKTGEYNIPTGVTSVLDYAFANCSGLTSVTIPVGVTSIGYSVFQNCSSLTSVTIPATVSSIGGSAFSGFTGSIVVDQANAIYSSADGVLFNKAQTQLIQCPISKTGNYNIPAGLTSIGILAFSNCSSLTSVTIPATVSSIGGSAFSGFTGSIVVDQANAIYSSADGVLFNKAQTQLIQCPISKTGNYNIPSGVTSIGSSAFSGCSGLTSVTIPSGVTSIGSSAFSGCSGLTSVTIPSRVSSIGSYAFANCSGLTSIYLNAATPLNLSSSPSVFSNVNATNCKLYVPIGATTAYKAAAQWSAFQTVIEYDVSVSKNIQVTDAGTLSSVLTAEELLTVTKLTITGTIDARDFKTMRDNMPSLLNIDLSAVSIVAYTGTAGTNGTMSTTYPINELPYSAFQGRSSLTSIIIPSGVTSIGSSAFSNCSSIISFTIPATVSFIGSSAFSGCSGLTSVTIPSGLTSIGSNVFQNCIGLTSVTISSGVSSIGSYAFSGCSSLMSFTIPATVSSIGSLAFQYFRGSIVVEETNSNYSSADGVLFNKTKTQLIQCPVSKTGEYNIPTGVTSVLDYAFANCSGLTSVTIPVGVTSIGYSVFQNCIGLTSVTIPSGVSYIGSSAFSGCSGLTSVTIPSRVSSIGSSAFSNCTGLTSIYSNAATPVNLSSSPSVFSNVNTTNCKLYVPIGATIAYKGAAQWSAFQTVIEHDVSVSKNIQVTDAGTLSSVLTAEELLTVTKLTITGTIDARDFKTMRDNMPSLLNIDLSAVSIVAYTGTAGTKIPISTIYPVNELPYSAFQGRSSLTSIIIPVGLTSIGGYAFANCGGLISFTIPATVSSIGSLAFQYFRGSIVVQETNSNYSSADGVLFNKTKSQLIQCSVSKTGEYNIPTGVTSVLDYAFADCSGLTSVTIPVGVTSIGYSVFQNCIGLTSVTIPSGVSSIGSFAFSGCSGLTSVTIPSGLTSIGNNVFQNCIGLTSVAIPSGVSSIGSSAFSGCSGLTSVTIPSRVSSIGSSAFSGCSGLTSVTIPARVSSIGSSAFSNCTGLTSIYSNAATPVNLSSSPSVFSNVNATNCKLYVPIGAATAYQAASQWSNFQNVVEHDVSSVSKIIQVDVAGTLSSVLTAEELATVTDLAISGTIDARDFKTIRDNIPLLLNIDLSKVSIAAYTGTEGTSGTYLTTYPANVLPQKAFYLFISPITKATIRLNSIELPISIISIGDYAFANCSVLTAVTIPATVRSIGRFAFQDFRGSIVVEETNTSYSSSDGVLFNNAQTQLIQCPVSKTGDYNIPDGVSSIENNAFQNCSVLTSVTMPSGIISIGDKAFQDCSGLTSVTIPSGLTSIGSSAFSKCSSIISFTIPATVSSIGSSAFFGFTGSIIVDQANTIYSSADGVLFNKTQTQLIQCPISKSGKYYIPSGVNSIESSAFDGCSSLTSVIIPTGVTSIGFAAFSHCSGLTSIYTNVISPVNLSSNAFAFFFVNKNKCILYVPVGTKTTYQAAAQWKDFKNIVEQVSKTIQINVAGTLSSELTPAELSTVTNLTITGTIDSRDFKTMRDNMPVLVSIDLSDVTISAYTGTDGTLSSASSSVQSVPQLDEIQNKQILYGVVKQNVKKQAKTNAVTYPANELPQYAFSNPITRNANTTLLSMNLPISVTSIGEAAFYDCSSLTFVAIPVSVTSIGADAFVGTSGSFIVEGANSAYSSVDEVLFNKDQTILMQCPVSKTGDYVIPAAVTSIATAAFRNCKELTSVTIPASVISIGSSAFAGTSGSFIVEGANSAYSSVDEVLFNKDQTILMQCPVSKKESYEIPISVTSIVEAGFYACDKLTQLSLPNNLISIGDLAFSGCSGINKISVASLTPCTIYANTFYGVNKQSCMLQVPVGKVSLYRNTNFWSSFFNISENFSTDYFRSVISGNWDVNTTWESSVDGINDWKPAPVPPTSSAAAISISNADLVTITDNATSSTLTVNPGAKLTLMSGKTLITNAFTLQSDISGSSTFVDNGGTLIASTSSVQQYLTAGRNWYFSSPMNGVSSTVFSATGTNPLYYFVEPNSSNANTRWAQISTSGTALSPTVGYIVNMDATLLTNQANLVTFTGGTLNTGSITTGQNGIPSLTRTVGQERAGFNLVGNPYPSYLSWSAVTRTDIEPTVWYRTKVNDVYKFYTYLIGGAALDEDGIAVPAGVVTNLIPPMQAFWVRVSAGKSTGSLGFNNGMRNHRDQTTNILKAPTARKSTNQLVRLKISNAVNEDETVIYFNPNASNGFDTYDSPKMSNENPSIPEIYSTVGAEKLVINGMNSIPYDNELAIGFMSGKSASFTLKATEINNLDETVKIILKDKDLNVEQELTLN